MDPYYGEIRLFAGNYAPRDWMYCEGQLLLIQQYSALYAVIGVTYGGDAKTTFALPDLRNALVPLGKGQGPGLTPRPLNSTGGNATETLTWSQMANHGHSPAANNTTAAVNTPVNGNWANQKTRPAVNIYSRNPSVQMHPNAIALQGGGQAHNNLQPGQNLAYIIAVDNAVFPVKAN